MQNHGSHAVTLVIDQALDGFQRHTDKVLKQDKKALEAAYKAKDEAAYKDLQAKVGLGIDRLDAISDRWTVLGLVEGMTANEVAIAIEAMLVLQARARLGLGLNAHQLRDLAEGQWFKEMEAA
ncbi:hypothetical protein BB934_45415 (plasmid) [Microvirga ossetica]|uniref:Uncharacterized protein n=1 Tax=Microvirga ossetica TaxID=1882682 RepID=A0A1B2EZR1_9HYPH|nr:hypothetical protein [Microvirga ossetica]ANY85461.1 hypothetical protein BB934_45415 [Microvirga ossetica]